MISLLIFGSSLIFFPVFSSATPVGGTPSSKRKLPLESTHSFAFSNKKRRSVKKNLGMELFPNTLFSGTLTPSSGDDDDVFNQQKWFYHLSAGSDTPLSSSLFILVYSASGVLDSSQNTLSPAGRLRRQPATSARRKSRRLSSQHTINRQGLTHTRSSHLDSQILKQRDAPQTSWIHPNLYPLCFSRVESGKTGCFSPKVTKREALRKPLRLRFSLGKSSKDAVSVAAR